MDMGCLKHRSTFLEDQLESNQPNQWLMQPSYKTKYLLFTQGGLSSKDSFSATGQLPSFPHESLESEWETANRYHFKSMASVHVLRHICLNFHKDFTLEQVNRSGSFLDHLIEIQQQQRAAAYGLADQLTRLRRCSTLFENPFSSSFFCETVASSECYFAQNQHTTYICMWPQKARPFLKDKRKFVYNVCANCNHLVITEQAVCKIIAETLTTPIFLEG